MRRLFLTLVWIYQKALSPLFPGCCRFTPVCSDYARQAIEVHGAAKGSLLALWRLARCHPLCKGGHDPVPPPHPTDEPQVRRLHG